MRKALLLCLYLSVCVAAFAHAPEPGKSYSFIQNKGQWPTPVLYQTELPQGRLYLEKTGFTYNFLEPSYFNPEQPEEKNQPGQKFNGHAFQVKFLGANSRSNITPQNQEPGYRNYFIGSDARRWATNVNSFGSIRYAQLFPGIDLHLYTSKNTLKYDYIVAPQAQVAAIKMKYEGVQQLRLQEGKLIIQTSVNEFLEEAPYAYQEINGEKKAVACSFTLQYQTVGFEITGPYDPTIPLIIDPELVFVTYSGAASSVSANCVTADAIGNSYTGVHLLEPGYPTTAGAYQTIRQGANIVISKFSENGQQLLFSTYLGGSQSDYPLTMTVNAQNELVILGTTNSNNFPTFSSSYDKVLGSDPDLLVLDYVVAKLSLTGDKLLATTYLGGNAVEGTFYSELPAGLTFDNTGNIYVGVNTQSANFPEVKGFQQQHHGNYDGAIVKLNSGLSQIIWSSFLGGSSNEFISDIKVGTSGQVYVSGFTFSRNFPTTEGVLNRNLSGFKDGFIAVVAAAGDQLLASSYIGTGSGDQVQLLHLDSEENIYALGYTNGHYPATTGTYNTPNAVGGYFIHKLNAALTETAFSTHIGNNTVAGSNFDLVPTAFKVDDCGSMYFSAYAVTEAPLTGDAYQTTRKSLYLCQLSKDAKTLLYGSYFGDTGFNHVHNANKSIITDAGYLHHIQCTTLDNYPVTAGAYSVKRSLEGNDGAVFRFKLTEPLSSRIKAAIEMPAFACAPVSISFTNRSENAINYHWDFGDGSTISTEANPQHVYQQAGIYKVTLTASTPEGCIPPNTTEIEVKVGAKLVTPNIITPNHDGKNDSFVIQNLLPGTHLKLYNRWGQLVYESRDYKNNWQADEVLTGIYYYAIEHPDACPPTLKGWLEVVK